MKSPPIPASWEARAPGTPQKKKLVKTPNPDDKVDAEKLLEAAAKQNLNLGETVEVDTYTYMQLISCILYVTYNIKFGWVHIRW
jgi:hypothetical protein